MDENKPVTLELTPNMCYNCKSTLGENCNVCMDLSVSNKEKVIEDLGPFFQPTFYEDIKKGYTIILAKSYNNPFEYKVQAFCRFLPYKEVILSGKEMFNYFSGVIIYLLTKGFILKFRDGNYTLNTLIEITVKYIGEQQSYIMSFMDVFSTGIPFSKNFNNYYIDYMLSHIEITSEFHEDLLKIQERTTYDR